MADVYVKDSVGNVGRMSSKKYADLKASGEAINYELASAADFDRQQSVAEHSTAGQTAVTTAEGAARGVTMGGSDALLGEAFGDEYSDHARARQEANPWAAGLGEAGGFAAASLATGGGRAAAGLGVRGAMALWSRSSYRGGVPAAGGHRHLSLRPAGAGR